jgi:5-methylcytosine-specific restriction endonuclease McrA
MSEAVRLYQFTECAHPADEMRMRADSLGRPQLMRQCLECGAPTSSALAQKGVDLAAVPAWDHDLPNSFASRARAMRAAVEQERAQVAEVRSQQWWDDYNAYLRTPEWARRREAVLERDGYLCRGCLRRPAEHVHHLTYAHVGHELAFELVSLCRSCHERAHEPRQ